MKKQTSLLGLPALLLLLLAACRPGTRTGTEAGKPILTVTIEPLRYFTEAIAGDRYEVVSMVPKGSSPETYDPTPGQLADLARSKAYLRIGYIGFEQVWLERLRQNAPRLPFFDLSEGIPLIYDDTHPVHTHAPGNYAEAEERAMSVEPHVWCSASNARIIACNIRDALSSLDPEHRAVYDARLDSLCLRLDSLDGRLRGMLDVPTADEVFLIYHPALSYFARDYGLLQIPIEAGGKEPSPARLKELIDRCRQLKVRIVFVQPEFDRRNAELIARQIGAVVVPINPLAYEWEQEMLRTAEALQGNG